MKTLEEIIKRDDYVRVNAQLSSRVEELAKKMRSKMNDLDLEEVDDSYFINTVKTRSGYSYEFLATYNENGNIVSLEDDESYYYVNDFNAYVRAAKHAQKKNFLNNAKRLFALLDEIETEKVQEAEKSLKENENL